MREDWNRWIVSLNFVIGQLSVFNEWWILLLTDDDVRRRGSSASLLQQASTRSCSWSNITVTLTKEVSGKVVIDKIVTLRWSQWGSWYSYRLKHDFRRNYLTLWNTLLLAIAINKKFNCQLTFCFVESFLLKNPTCGGLTGERMERNDL